MVSGFLFVVTGTEKGKTLLTDVTNSAMNEYVTENAHIGEVQVQWPLKVILHNVVIYDHKDSILFRSEGLRLTPVWPPIQDSVLLLDQLVLTHFEANMKHYEEDSDYNYAYAFKKIGGSSGKSSPIQSVKLRKLIFEEGTFAFKDYHKAPFHSKGSPYIDFYRLETSAISGTLDSVVLAQQVIAKLNGFSFRERSGFVMRNMDATMTITDSSFVWNKVLMKTNEGVLDADVSFDFNNWKSWSNFNDSIKINAQIRPSSIFSKDLAFFAPAVKDRFTQIRVSGNSYGTLGSFRGKNLNIGIGKESYVVCALRMTGLPDIDNTFIQADVKESKLVLQEILSELNQPALPKQIRLLGDIEATGNFTGFTNDFVAKGAMRSALGYAESDIHLSLPEEGENQYSGNLDLVDFNLGKMLGEPDIGTVTFTSELSGSGNSRETVKASLKSAVKHFQYRGYDYRNVEINGKVANQYFNGELKSADENANLNISGKVDFTQKVPTINVTADVRNLALHKLNLSKDSISVQTVTQMNFTGNNIENFVGQISTQNLDLKINQRQYATGLAKISGNLTPNGKSWKLESDIARAELETSVLLKDLIAAIANHGIALLPKDMGLTSSSRNDYIVGNLEVFKSKMVNSLLPNDIKLSEGTKVDLLINDASQNFFIDLTIPSFEVAGLTLSNTIIKLKQDTNNLFGVVDLDNLSGEGFSVSKYHLDIENDSSSLYLSHQGRVNDSLLGFNTNHSIAYSETPETKITIDNSELFFVNDTFSINSDSIAWEADNIFRINRLNLSLYDQNLELNGWADLKKNYDIRYSLSKLQIESLSTFLPEYFSVMTGELNGDGRVRSNKGQPVVEAAIAAEPVYFRELDLKSITIKSEYQDESSALGLVAQINGKADQEILRLRGGYFFGPNPRVEATLSLDKTPAQLFEVLATGIVSDLKGTVSSRVRITGPIKSPELSGWVSFDSLKAHVDYLGVDYAMSDTLGLNKKNIIIKKLTMTDSRGEKATVSGKIEHNMLSQFNLDLAMDCKNFTVLNTEEADNELYYGQLYATGTAGFNGPLISAKVSCDLTTEKGTKFFIPIQEDQGYSQESFIRFVNKDEPTEDYQINDQSFSLDLNINANTNAETQLIFDKQLGDIIRAVGNGRINMSLSPAGELNMFGDYIIERGNYLFTAFDLINKRFEIEKGSKISWLGDPYDADIDIRANYYLKANALNLVSSLLQYDADRLDEYRTPVPVVAYADLKGSLLDPKITLDFEFVNEGGADVASLQRELDNLQLPEEELTKQVVSLLVLNRFMPVYTSTGGNTDLLGSSVNTGLGDLISNQLTYWLSSISDNLQIDVNYTTGQENVQNENGDIVLSQSELELALSTTLFNDRISLNFAYELQNGYSPNKEIAYKVNQDGTAKVLVFQRQTQNPVITYESNTYGLGFFIKREFESFRDLFKKKDPTK